MRGLVPWLAGGAIAVLYASLLAGLPRFAPGAELLTLWGKAAIAAGGASSFAETATVYPPLPFLASILAEFAARPLRLPGPVLVAAIAGGALAAGWCSSFLRAGLQAGWAVFATLCVALHPFTLALVASGPEAVLVAGAAWWLALGLVGLRAGGAVAACVTVALALGAAVLAGPAGLLLAAASPVALMLAAPRDLGRSAGSLVLLVHFPLGFALLGLVYLNATNGTGALAWLEVLQPAAEAEGAAPPGLAVLLLAGLPVLPLLAILGRGSLPLRRLGLALLAMAITPPVLAFGLALPLAVPALIAPALGCAVVALGLLLRGHGTTRGLALALPPVMLLSGGGVLAVAPGPWWEPPASQDQARMLARAITGQRNVLVDPAAMPELVALRGSVAGLVLPSDAAFQLQALSGRLSTPVVVVRDPGATPPPWRPDRVHAAFPRLHADGAPGYRLMREIGQWRIYGRES